MNLQTITKVDVDPITVELIGNALNSIVEEMGETLIRAAYSTNIKERRDCSTALFDARGRTLVQAEHIPDPPGQLHRGDRGDNQPAPIPKTSTRVMSSSATTPIPAAARICPTSSWPRRFLWTAR